MSGRCNGGLAVVHANGHEVVIKLPHWLESYRNIRSRQTECSRQIERLYHCDSPESRRPKFLLDDCKENNERSNVHGQRCYSRNSKSMRSLLNTLEVHRRRSLTNRLPALNHTPTAVSVQLSYAASNGKTLTPFQTKQTCVHKSSGRRQILKDSKLPPIPECPLPPIIKKRSPSFKTDARVFCAQNSIALKNQAQYRPVVV